MLVVYRVRQWSCDKIDVLKLGSSISLEGRSPKLGLAFFCEMDINGMFYIGIFFTIILHDINLGFGMMVGDHDVVPSRDSAVLSDYKA